ncbi:hypothetical protein [Yinghuangia soli]|uniref:DUF2336 domain-containing protein n=1 Tax=Yinghuangia soli TaxID=2908204 RepID=A0AA41PW53_9ACTN|nr:hypothetical protein [Yinghuangia soli]MCF2526988.1 hypothetical protein [Yinghuangia soli]
MNPLALLLDQAPASITDAVLRRIDPRLRAEIFAPPSFAEPSRVGRAAGAYLVAHGSVRERAKLAANRGAPPETLMDLASDPEPDVAAGIFGNASSPREARLRVMPQVVAATPLRDLLYSEPDHRQIPRRDALLERICVLVESDDPRVVTRAFERLAEHGAIRPWLSGVALRGCLSFLRTAGPAAVTAALPQVLPHVTEQPSPAVAEALARPTDPELLASALAEFSGMPALLTRLRDARNLPDAAAMLLAPRAPLDWDLIDREHRKQPFPDPVRMALTRQLGCPANLRTYYPVPVPQDVRITHWVDAPPETETAAVLLSTPFNAHGANKHIRRAHTNGWISAAAILTHGAPARNAMRILNHHDAARHADACTALRALTAPTLGRNTEAWAVALALLPDFTGPLPHLLKAAQAITMPRT